MLTRIKSIYIVWGIGFAAILAGNLYDLIFPSFPAQSGIFEGMTVGGGITFAAFALFILHGFYRFAREIFEDLNRGRKAQDNLKG